MLLWVACWGSRKGSRVSKRSLLTRLEISGKRQFLGQRMGLKEFLVHVGRHIWYCTQSLNTFSKMLLNPSVNRTITTTSRHRWFGIKRSEGRSETFLNCSDLFAKYINHIQEAWVHFQNGQKFLKEFFGDQKLIPWIHLGYTTTPKWAPLRYRPVLMCTYNTRVLDDRLRQCNSCSDDLMIICFGALVPFAKGEKDSHFRVTADGLGTSRLRKEIPTMVECEVKHLQLRLFFRGYE